MPRAILRDGVIYPLEPLPADWSDGRELWVEEAIESGDNNAAEIELWKRDVEALIAQIPPENYPCLESALAEIHHQEKEIARKEMGL